MSIGQLGSSSERFRDFLGGGGQRDIGLGLQTVLSTYSDPNGNFNRLSDRSRGMFQLTDTEYQAGFDRDAQNQFAEVWYREYRAVLLLRAEALKKKLNRSYAKVMENSIYAPVRPGEEWAPQANRDFNDIDADNPMEFYDGATVDGIDVPTDTQVDTTVYAHPEWFSGTDKFSQGEANAYDDIRTYMNLNFPLDDLDGDGDNEVTFDPGGGPSGSDAPWDSTYSSSSGAAANQYYDLWDQGIIDIGSPSVNSDAWYKDIALNMNVPPSTLTQNFEAVNGSPGNTYFIELPNDSDTMTAAQKALLPGYAFTAADPIWSNSSVSKAPNGAKFKFFTSGGQDYYYLGGGSKFYDPRGAVSQNLFTPDPVGDPASNNPITSISLNSDLVPPPGAFPAEQDFGSGSNTIPVYQEYFTDSWREARQVQKREAQIESVYQAYVDGEAGITDMTYEEIMDDIFSNLDQLAGGPAPAPSTPSPVSPPAPPTPPSDVPSSAQGSIDGLLPYGYYVQPGSSPNIVSPTANDIYGVGKDYFAPGTPNEPDQGSLYNLIYQRLAIAADPTSIPGGNSGTDVLTSGTTPVSPSPTPPSPPPGTRDTLGGSSELYSPIPVGAAEKDSGQPNINDVNGLDDLDDTTRNSPTQASTIDKISKLFVGRQWDYVPGFDPANAANEAGQGAVKYEAETISAHFKILPGWWYDSAGQLAGTGPQGPALLTLGPAIDGYAYQSFANQWGLGRVDDYSNSILGGPFYHVGGGSDSLGIVDLDQTSTKYSLTSGFGMGLGGIYWGHTSAIGTIDKIDELMENSNGQNEPGFGFNTIRASLGALAAAGGGNSGEMSVFPNVGLAGFHQDLNFPVPIPPPVGPSFFNIPLTTYGAVSYDLLTDWMYKFLEAMKHEVLDSLSVYSYATGGGYAMDSYGMRGEYHFTEKTSFSVLDKLPEFFGLVDVGTAIETAVDMIGLDDYTINNYDLNEDGIFDGTRRHSMNAGEQRELDTGAFFTTAAFLSQFQLDSLQYSYWTSTHQNEEMANMDMTRMMVLTGKELMSTLGRFLFGAAGRLKLDGPLWWVVSAVLNFMLSTFEAQVNEALIWDLLLRDQNEKGFVTSDEIRSSSLTSEGYDFIEDDRKLYAYDMEQTRKQGFLGQLANFGMGSFELPNQVLNGLANTRRYKPYMEGPDGRAGRQGWGDAFGGDWGDVQPGGGITKSTAPPGYFRDPTDRHRVHPLSNHLDDDSYFDNNWDIRLGYWNDTGLGDINEVYVRKNVVTYGAAIENGLANENAPTVETVIDRYVGSHNRIIGRGYDGATPLNLQSFRTGYFHDRYFGTFIHEIEPDVVAKNLDGADTNNKIVSYDVVGAVDGNTNVSFNLHGGQKFYDRRNDYNFNVQTADGTNINLRKDEALAPVFGGNMLLTSLDANDSNQINELGASTTGQENPLTKVLLEHLRVKDDGSNANLVREYRDVFNLGLLDDIFVTASANAPTGGGVTSSVRIKFRSGIDAGAANAPSFEDPNNTGVLPTISNYENRRYNEIVGSKTVIQDDGTNADADNFAEGSVLTRELLVAPGFLGRRSHFKNTNRAIADIYLSSYFAFKRQPTTDAG